MSFLLTGVRGLAAAILAAMAITPEAGDASPTPTPLRVEAVVMLMRHGVRPPTKDPAMPSGVASDPWPTWPVPAGHLTPHGAAAVMLLGKFDRKTAVSDRLFGYSGCPEKGSVAVWADTDERTLSSARSWLDGFAPGCDVAVEHVVGDNDPLFSPLEAGQGQLVDGGMQAVRAHLGSGGLEKELSAQHERLYHLGRVLGCCSAPICDSDIKACALAELPSRLVPGKGRPRLNGPLDLGATASQILMLEYVEGKPMNEVGWGRVSQAEISDLLELHPAQYRILLRPRAIGRANALPIARRMLQALIAGPVGPKITILVGHDTNIASLGSMLDLLWKVASFPADDPPPGGALIFERLIDASGRTFVRAGYRSQTMDQMRLLTPLEQDQPAFHQYIQIPGCPITTELVCPLEIFESLIN
jgi:4-phytase/acid phosphatase